MKYVGHNIEDNILTDFELKSSKGVNRKNRLPIIYIFNIHRKYANIFFT